MTGKYILIAANECLPEVEEEYNRWYDEIHLPMFFEFPGLKKASRYKTMREDPALSRYLAFYEFDTEEDLVAFPESEAFKKAVEDFDRKWQHGEFVHRWGASYRLLTRLEK